MPHTPLLSCLFFTSLSSELLEHWSVLHVSKRQFAQIKPGQKGLASKSEAG